MEEVTANRTGGRTEVMATIVPGKSLCLLFGLPEMPLRSVPDPCGMEQEDIGGGWTRSQCESVHYPDFEKPVTVDLPEDMAAEHPRFSGLVRYEKTISVSDASAYRMLEITDAGDSVELFINGHSLGVQAAVPFVFDLRGSLVLGENRIVIEAATTLERALFEDPKSKTGITGRVYLLK